MKPIDEVLSEASAVGLWFIGPYRGIGQKVAYECPVHGEIAQTPNKVQQGIGCQKCGRQKQFASRRRPIEEIEREAIAVGLEYLFGYSSSHSAASYRCPVHGVIQMPPASVKRGSRCRKCASAETGLKRRRPRVEKVKIREARVSVETLRQRAHAVGLRYEGGYARSHDAASYMCPVHGEIVMRPAVVRRGGGCQYCAGNTPKSDQALSDEAKRVGLEFVGPYKGDSRATFYRCAKHGVIQKRPSDVKQGKFCRKCAKFGFDPVSPAVFYVYRVERLIDPSFIGYGLTKDHQTRHAAHMAVFKRVRASGELLATFDLPNGRAAADLEIHIRHVMADSHLRTPIRGFKEEAIALSEEPRLFAVIADWMTRNQDIRPAEP